MTRQSTESREGGGDIGPFPKFRCRWGPLPSHIDSSQICQLLCPPPGIRELMIRKGITPRNHFKDNRVAISQRSAMNHAMRQALTSTTHPFVKVMKAKPNILAPRKVDESATNFVVKNVKEVAHVATRSRRAIEEKEKKCKDKYKENFGKIPSYLIKRKIELAQQMQQKLKDEKNQQIPPGYVEMTKDEKDEILKALRENKAILEKKFSAFPLVCDTPTLIRAKANMDLELQDIEQAIKRFSRPHVYISLND